MTLLAPVSTPDLTVIEQRQPDVPLICTFRLFRHGVPMMDPCPKTAQWEALCFGCGRVLRACDSHMALVRERATGTYVDLPQGASFKCRTCRAPVFPEQYGRIPA